MSKGKTTNILVVLVVATVVAGAAWLRSQRSESTTLEKLPRLVDLGGNKCKECLALAPILAELRSEFQGRLHIECINVQKNSAAKDVYHIRLIPTQILFDRDGREIWRHEGFISKTDLQTVFAEKVGIE